MHAQQKGRLKTCNTGFQTASRFFKIPPRPSNPHQRSHDAINGAIRQTRQLFAGLRRLIANES
ncbi:hypothetical protein HMPREF9120_00536 [Neisseria sp. oral taxon 020 str. F0370]|nr:hypothetical protein HMPREF9120_00536 [Neisseria sp. oral taxon 020 str. F0370]